MEVITGMWVNLPARRRGWEGVLPVALDTVVVEPDNERVMLIWRGVWNVHGYVYQNISIRVEAKRLNIP